MGNIIEKTKHQEAYKCENGHFILKYRQSRDSYVRTSMSFYGCCPECGSKEISEVTGIWEREYEINNNFLFGKSKKLAKEKFVESIFSWHDRKEKRQITEAGKSFTVSFKFTVGQTIKTLFENEGVVQVLAYERGGSKDWMKFPDNKFDAWFWEDELISVNESPFRFKK